jgi:PilZ domain
LPCELDDYVPMEHRWGQRFNVDMPIRFTLRPASCVSIGRLVNVSLSGGFISSHQDLRWLSRIQLLFESTPRAKPGSEIAGYIARKSDAGIGIEWCELAPPAVAELVRYLNPIQDASAPADSQHSTRRRA